MKALLGRLKQDPLDSMDLTMAFSDEELRVDVKERVLPCGHLAYWAVVNWYSFEDCRWIDIGTVHESDLERVITLLQEAHDYLKNL